MSERHARKSPIQAVAALAAAAVLLLTGAACGSGSTAPATLTPPPTSPAASSQKPSPTAWVPTAEATALPTVAAVPTIEATMTPTAQGTAVPTAPEVSGTPSAGATQATDTKGLAREVLKAYLHYWDVRTKAYYTLDTSRLHEVMSGKELQRDVEQIRQLRKQGRAIKPDIKHNPAVSIHSEAEAVVYDEYVNASLYVHADTKKVIPTKEPPVTEKVSYVMRKLNGTWKVVDGVRQE